MLQLFPEHVEQIRQEAVEAFPEEAAWLITADGKCRQVENIHEDPENYFDISARDVAAAKKRGLLAVVHSHCNGQHYPSEMDMQFQINTNVPWGIVLAGEVGASRIAWWGGATEETIEPLDERTFRHGMSDCYSALRDYHRLKMGIILPDFARGWEWWAEEDKDLLSAGFEKAGFRAISQDQARPGDVWLASLSSRKPGKLNHCGILIDNDLTYHQPGSGKPVDPTRKAVTEPIYRYLQQPLKWLRHKERE